jgi:hypothetical protein
MFSGSIPLLALILCLPAMAQQTSSAGFGCAIDIIGSNQPTVPEPSSLLLLGAGLMYAAASLRARTKR